MDVNVPLLITRGLRRRGVDILTAQEDQTTRLSDPELLRRARKLGRILFSQDEDLIVEAVRCQREANHLPRLSFPAIKSSPCWRQRTPTSTVRTACYQKERSRSRRRSRQDPKRHPVAR